VNSKLSDRIKERKTDMPRTPWGWQITPDELDSWIIHDEKDLLVLNKPPHVLCHRSKQGPWSSLIGACREHFSLPRLHMPSRLDRETSGVILLCKDAALASRLQRAIEGRRVRKTYLALLAGNMAKEMTVEQPIARATSTAVHVRSHVDPDGKPAQTQFTPIHAAGGITLARVRAVTGRLHQIRVHAAFAGYPVIGDKVYGPDEKLFLEFLQSGWTPRLESILHIDHHALHASEWTCEDRGRPLHFTAPIPATWRPLLDRAEIPFQP